MSPIFKRIDGYTFKIFSNEESRMHIHVVNAEKEAKFWLEPEVDLDENYGFSTKEIKSIFKIITDYADEFKANYIKHIGKRLDD